MDAWRATLIRTIGLATSVAVLAASPPGAGAQPGSVRDISVFACPAVAGADPFVDVSGSVHGEAIHCAAAHGLVEGRTPDTFEPAGLLTRGQAATVVFRFLGLAGVPMDTAAPVPFDDIAGSVHEAHIRAVASVRVVRGVSETSFAPGRHVTRGQLASMLVGAVVTTGAFMEIGPDAFDDDAGSPHETSIDALSHNGITHGIAPRRFAPGAVVRRDAMASLVVRATDFAIEHGGLSSPHATDHRLAALTPEAVVGRQGDDDDARGRALLWTLPQGDVLCFDIGTTDVGSDGVDHPEAAAYLAAGSPGQPGEVLVELPPPSAANAVPEGFDSWSGGCVRTDPRIVQRFVAEPEGLHVGVATFEDGEVLRGPLERRVS